MARLLLLPWLFLLPFVHPQLHSDPAFLKFADYSDIEDLLLLAEGKILIFIRIQFFMLLKCRKCSDAFLDW